MTGLDLKRVFRNLMRLLHCPVLILLGSTGALAQAPHDLPKIPSYQIEATSLPPSVTQGITYLPLEVDIERALQFVKLGFGPQVLGQRGFQSTQFLTPRLSTTQAAQVVAVIAEYDRFKGPLVAEGIKRFAGRVSAIEFGREGSPVLYVHLPYWTHQTEGPIGRGMGSRISDDD